MSVTDRSPNAFSTRTSNVTGWPGAITQGVLVSLRTTRPGAGAGKNPNRPCGKPPIASMSPPTKIPAGWSSMTLTPRKPPPPGFQFSARPVVGSSAARWNRCWLSVSVSMYRKWPPM